MYRRSLKICTRSRSSQDGHCGTCQVPNSLCLLGVRSTIVMRTGIQSMFTVSRRLSIFGQTSLPNVEYLRDLTFMTGPTVNNPQEILRMVLPYLYYAGHTLYLYGFSK